MKMHVDASTVERLSNGWFQFLLNTTKVIESPGWMVEVAGIPVYPLWPCSRGDKNWLACCRAQPDNLPWTSGTYKQKPLPTAEARRSYVLLAQDEGVMSAIAWIAANRLNQWSDSLILLADWNVDLPFQPQPSLIMLPGMPPEVTASIALLEDWKVPARFASADWRPGFYEGTAKELAGPYLARGWQILTFD